MTYGVFASPRPLNPDFSCSHKYQIRKILGPSPWLANEHDLEIFLELIPEDLFGPTGIDKREMYDCYRIFVTICKALPCWRDYLALRSREFSPTLSPPAEHFALAHPELYTAYLREDARNLGLLVGNPEESHGSQPPKPLTLATKAGHPFLCVFDLPPLPEETGEPEASLLAAPEPISELTSTIPYLISPEEFARAKRRLPRKRGNERLDDRLLISAIIHVLRTNLPWSDCPSGYGKYSSIRMRFERWHDSDVWKGIVKVLAGPEKNKEWLSLIALAAARAKPVTGRQRTGHVKRFKLSDEQWDRLKPALSELSAGPADIRNTISAIVHVLRNDLNWWKCPIKYEVTKISGTFKRWVKFGVWDKVVTSLACDLPELMEWTEKRLSKTKPIQRPQPPTPAYKIFTFTNVSPPVPATPTYQDRPYAGPFGWDNGDDPFRNL